MGMKKKMLSATLLCVMVGLSLVAPASTVQAADDTFFTVNVGSYRATGTGDSGKQFDAYTRTDKD